MRILSLSAFLLFSFPSYAQVCSAYNKNGISKENNITYLQIADDLGNVRYTNNAISSNSGKNFTINSGSPVKLIAGHTYVFTVKNDSNPGTGCASLGVWVDGNINGTFSGSENLLNPSNTSISGCKVSYSVTMPCFSKNGKSYLRLRTGNQGLFDTSNACGTMNMAGNIADLEITQETDKKIKNTFGILTTTFAMQKIKFAIDTPRSGHSYLWQFNYSGKKYASGVSVSTGYSASGTYDISVLDLYCNTRDSWTQTITIVSPTSAPTANFSGPATSLVGEKLLFKDNSGNGAYGFEWEFKSPSGNVEYFYTDEVVFQAWETGNYDVCLTASNLVGPSSRVCKTAYLKVGQDTTNVWGGMDVHLISDGKKSSIDYYSIVTCKAKTLEMTLKKLRLYNGNTIRIYDGKDGTGYKLASIDYSNQGKFRDSLLQSKTGAFYIEKQAGYGNCSCDMDTILSFYCRGTRDTTPPTLELSGADTLYFPVGTPASDQWLEIAGTTYRAFSKWSGNLTSNVTITSDVNYAVKGIYHEDFVVYDCDGSKSTQRRVIVVDQYSKNYFARLKLRVFGDMDKNGIYSSGDILLPDQKIVDTINYRFVYTNDSGCALYYPHQKQMGFQVKPDSNWKYSIPSNGIRRWNYLALSDTIDFALLPTVKTDSFNLRLLPVYNLQSATKGRANEMKFILENYSFNTIDSAEVLLKIDRKFSYTFYGTQPHYRSDSLYKIRYYYIQPFGRKRINLELYIGTKDTGVIYQSIQVLVLGIQKDADSSNNQIKTRKVIIYPHDPNFKTVTPGAEMQQPGELLTYLVEFQNEGTAAARNVIVRDTLTYDLEASTFQYLSSSFPCEISLENHVLVFEFININLQPKNSDEPKSHGWVQFQVKVATSIPVLTAVKNTASIYFDWENPVQTNWAAVVYAPVPKIRLQGNARMKIPVCSKYSESGAEATDTADGNISQLIKISGTVNPVSLKNDTIVYLITNSAGKTARTVRVVEKYDSIKPHLFFNGTLLKQGIQIKIPVFSTYKEPITAWDSCMGTLAVEGIPKSGIKLNLNRTGMYEITYQAFDLSGNPAAENGITVQYLVQDTIPPQIIFNTSDSICVEKNKLYESVKPTVTDNYSVANAIALTMVSDVNVAIPGMYTETYTATDESGNTAKRNRMVQVGNCLSQTASMSPESNIEVYPNPADAFVSVLTPVTSSVLLYELRDVGGKLLVSGTLDSGNIGRLNTATLASGLYVISIRCGSQISILKILIQH